MPHRIVSIAYGLLVVAGIVIVSHVWLDVPGPVIAGRLLITLGVALGLVLAWGVIQRERSDMDRLRNRDRPG